MTRKQPAALWRIKFDNDQIGEEDLEEFEILDAIQVFKKACWCVWPVHA
jgi:hypothetical protein